MFDIYFRTGFLFDTDVMLWGMSIEELRKSIPLLDAIRIEVDNPVASILMGVLAAAGEEAINRRGDRDERESVVNRARVNAAIVSLQAIPSDEWQRWSETPQADFIEGVQDLIGLWV
jgi:hypothetical protein